MSLTCCSARFRLLAYRKNNKIDPSFEADVVPSVRCKAFFLACHIYAHAFFADCWVVVGVKVGVDISNIQVNKKQTLQLKEVGGAMMPLWPMVSNSCVEIHRNFLSPNGEANIIFFIFPNTVSCKRPRFNLCDRRLGCVAARCCRCCFASRAWASCSSREAGAASKKQSGCSGMQYM